MMRFLRQQWWKWTSIVLLLFAFFSGLFIPLGAGIETVAPEQLFSGTSVPINIKGYNTHFTSEATTKVFLQSKKMVICAKFTEVASERNLIAGFDIPVQVVSPDKKEFFNLVVQNETDGTFFLRNAVSIAFRESETDFETAPCNEKIKVFSAGGIVFPYREILYESIRNLFFHVPMWFGMILLLVLSFGSSIKYLTSNDEMFDIVASSFAAVALFFGLLGILTGMQWANFTWGSPWPKDPKLNGAAVGMLVYLAYFVLRGSLENEQTRARVSSVYNIFAFNIYIVFIFVLPRLNESLHPGSGGNPGFNTYDLDNIMRPVFYAAVLGFSGVGYWIASLLVRYRLLHNKTLES